MTDYRTNRGSGSRHGGMFSGIFGGTESFKWEDTFSAAFTNTKLRSDMQDHLVKVYSTLSLGVIAASIGVYFYLLTHINYVLPLLLSMGSIFGLHSTSKENIQARLGWFCLMAFSQGISMGGLVEVALYVDPSIVLVALMTTLVLFISLSVASYKAEERSYLYLGAMLGSAVGWMAMLSFLNIFIRSQILWNINLYGGLLVFSGYVIFDTQLILYKFDKGDRDFLSHALQLFQDLVAIFVRILVILLKNEEDKEKKRRRRNH